MPAAALVVAAVAAVASTTTSIISGNQARASARHAADLQTQAQEEQQAQNAQRAQDERRAQIRQERVQRARIEQASVNSGAEGSSGELGALGALTTNANQNIGESFANQARAGRIGLLNQEAANSIFDAKNTLSKGQSTASIFNTIGSIAGTYATAGSKAKVGSTGTYDTSFDNPSDYG